MHTVHIFKLNFSEFILKLIESKSSPILNRLKIFKTDEYATTIFHRTKYSLNA